MLRLRDGHVKAPTQIVDISGNKYRFIVLVDYTRQTVFIRNGARVTSAPLSPRPGKLTPS
jgi:mRNA-degrading endonuclease HigB of HigAB toxin-antitoxin module